jgi:hypothetical protein
MEWNSFDYAFERNNNDNHTHAKPSHRRAC